VAGSRADVVNATDRDAALQTMPSGPPEGIVASGAVGLGVRCDDCQLGRGTYARELGSDPRLDVAVTDPLEGGEE
jgi:hypothetical protein